MLREMPYTLFQEWQAYADLEPFDESRQDLRIASINQTLWNINRDTKKHPASFPIHQFVLPFGDSKISQAVVKRQQSWKEQKFIGKMIATSFGAKVISHSDAAALGFMNGTPPRVH